MKFTKFLGVLIDECLTWKKSYRLYIKNNFKEYWYHEQTKVCNPRSYTKNTLLYFDSALPLAMGYLFGEVHSNRISIIFKNGQYVRFVAVIIEAILDLYLPNVIF